MTIQDFIAVWQAQPFRAFRIHSPGKCLAVDYPLAAGLTADMKVVAIAGDSHCETFSLEEISNLEVFGEPVSMADAVNGVAPETLTRNAQLMAAAMQSTSVPGEEVTPALRFDAGQVKLRGYIATNGIHMVEAAVSADSGDGPIFTTTGTRWNLHGLEQFENNTTLYLHHLDHPAVEQRVILWPPNTGTFDSFGEATPCAKLTAELVKRDKRLAKKPANPKNLPAAHFRKILPTYRVIEPDGRIDAFGDELDDDDFDRFEIHLVPRTLPDGVVVNNPCLVDVPAENFMFNLTETDWDAAFTRGEKTISLVLKHPRCPGEEFEMIIDPYFLTAGIPKIGDDLPLGFIERELRNFVLYERWELLIGALRSGPARLKQPDLVVPLAGGFVAEMWAGETRFPLPFLQPRILDANGASLLDFRATMWAASIDADKSKPEVTLRLWSHEQENRRAEPGFDLKLNLVNRRVTCTGHEGSTTIGMVQAMIEHVRGLKWLKEQLSEWLKKGRALPLP